MEKQLYCTPEPVLEPKAETASIRKKHKKVSQATMEKIIEERQLSLEHVWKNWAAHVGATTGKKCSFKKVKRLLNKLDVDTQKTAMTTPFELMPTSVKTAVVTIRAFNKCVPTDGEAANDPADEIELFSSRFIKDGNEAAKRRAEKRILARVRQKRKTLKNKNSNCQL